MIRDARNVESGAWLDFDVCIVGGGAAGITLALELGTAGARIGVLEAGGLRYERESQALLDGEVTGDAYPLLTDTRFSALGGSTKLWAGWCRPLDEADLEARPWVQNSGWPFGRAEMDPYYRRAHEICRLGDYEYDPAAWEARGGGRRLPLSDPDLTTSVFQVNVLDFGRTHAPALRASTNIQVILHAVALRLRSPASNGTVESVEVATLSGRRFEVRARIFVLAAGGIENPRLLLLSGESPERSLGNAHGLVGRYFSDHPFLTPGSFVAEGSPPSLAFYFPTPAHPRAPADGASVRGAISLAQDALARGRLLNGALFFRYAYEADPVYKTPEVRALLALWEAFRGRGAPGHRLRDLRTALRSPTRVAAAVWRRLVGLRGAPARWPVRTFFECESRESNRVVLSDRRDAFERPLPRIEWRLGELDLRSIRYGWTALDAALRRAGVGRLETPLGEDLEDWRSACEGGKHHMGTTRMHGDPSRGVVDARGRVHGTANLYVAGSSVFPTPGFANPTLTIVALAVRLARHLSERVNGREGEWRPDGCH